MAYKVTDTTIVDQSRNLSSIGIATIAGPVIVGSAVSTGTPTQGLQVTGGAYVSTNLGIGTTNPSSALSVIGDGFVSGIITGSVLVAAKDPGTGISTDSTESIFGNGWRLSSPASTTYYKLATLPAGGSGNTFDHLTLTGVLGLWTSTNQTPFEIYFSNRGSFNTKYISYGTIRSDVRILGISTNSTVEIWAQHQASAFTKLVYNITNSLQVIPVVNPSSTTTAPVGTTVFDSSTATPRFIINDSDNAGIGTINPTAKLHVQGDVSIASTVGIGTVIDIVPYDTLNSGTLSFEGSAGQLFSITNNLTSGSIFSVNDVSGIPSIDVDANGTIQLGPYGGNIGLGTTNPTSKLHVVGNALIVGIVTATTFVGNLTGTATTAGVSTSVIGGIGSITQLQVTGISTFTNGPVLIGSATTTGTASQPLQVTGGAYVSGSVGIGTNNPQYPLQVQGNARITGAIYDSTNSPGTSGQVLQSTVTGTQWTTAAAGGGSGKFDTAIDNVLYIQPTGTLDIVGVGTTTTQITTFPSSPPEYIIHSMHVTNISNGDAEITAGFVMNARKVPATISVSVGSSGGAGIHTFTVGSASSIRVGMAVTGTGNIGETTGIGTTAGFQFNTYVTSVDGNNITLSKPMSGYATGVLQFSPVSDVVSRLPVPVGSAVELLKQPMILNALDSIVLQSTGAGSGIGTTSTNSITYTSGSAVLTVTNQAASFFNSIAIGNLVQNTGVSTGIQANTYVGASYTGITTSYAGTGVISIPITRPVNATVGVATALSFTEVVVPQDGALQVTVVYQSSTDTSYQNGTGTVVGIVTSASLAVSGVTSTTPFPYYGTGNTYPSTIQSIRVSNISDGSIYPGGDYPVWVGIGNSDTIFSWLAYNMMIPKNSSIELCEAPKRLGIGQSIFAYSDTPNAIEIQIAGKQKI